MALDTRNYQAIHVDNIALERGIDRFTRDGIFNPPPVNLWRNNLTALSQTENLFFIASSDFVAVYEPIFPYQKLGRRPTLLIRPDLANPEASGYINPQNPHSINHLITGSLGSQEILLLARDSGNVEAYHIHSILGVIRRIPEDCTEDRLADVFGLRPFFSHWVKQSAWGLAIHQEARMIAVSANVPSNAQPADSEDTSATVTVFAFALSDKRTPPHPAAGTSSSHIEEDEWVEWVDSADTPTRDRNRKVILAGWYGHGHNIPNVSFVDTKDDKNGLWLLSTDINGYLKMWHIWKRSCFRTWNFHNSTRIGWIERGGWQVAALDVSSFMRTSTTEEFIGAARVPQYHGFLDHGESFNLTTLSQRVPNSSFFHPSHPSFGANADHLEEDGLVSGLSTSTNDSDHGFDFFIEEQDYPTPSSPAVSNAGRVSERVDSVSEGDDIQDESDGSDEAPNSVSQQLPSPPPEPGASMIRYINQKVTPVNDHTKNAPSVAILHCSNSHIRFLSDPQARFPHVFCANALKQVMPPSLLETQQGYEFQAMDRLNMLHKIPELGIVLIATQAGRVAVCALTQKQTGLLGLRIDWIVPTKQQEARDERPALCTLIGIALGPVQGYEDHPTSHDDSDDRSWTTDTIINGIETSFDPNIIVLQNEMSGPRSASTTGRHKRQKSTASSKRATYEVKLEPRPWKKPSRPQLHTSEKRYRVMLTYSDLSVLTYEISRPLE